MTDRLEDGVIDTLRRWYALAVPPRVRQPVSRLRRALWAHLAPLRSLGTHDAVGQELGARGTLGPARRLLRLASRLDERSQALVLGQWLEPIVRRGWHLEHFALWERMGFHVTPNHFHQPIPDSGALPEALWTRQSEMVGVDMNEPFQLHLLQDAFPRFHDEYRHFAREKTRVPHEFYYNNGFFNGADAPILYCMVRHFRPKRIIEIGSGFSTMISAAAALRNGHTELIAIEPHPGDLLRAGFPGLSALIPQKVEEVDPMLFSTLQSGDILFVDSSHAVRTGGDVTFIYLELLPRLPDGVVVHFHDIFLPREYPREWVVDKRIFWTEQYLLHAFLLFNRAFRVILSTVFMGERHPEKLRAAFPECPWWGGASFWIQRRFGDGDGRPVDRAGALSSTPPSP